MTESPTTIAEVNTLDRDGFVARFGGLYEGSPWIAAEAWADRPFADRAALHRALQAVVARATPARQLALIRAHPDLVGRAALAGTLGRASTAEQAAAGLEAERLSPDDVAAFAELNRTYRDRFGFPFVICARENKKDRILAGFAARLNNPRDDEIAVALSEIAKICHHRLADVLPEDA
jgi:OHCU decarboxylase